MRDDSSLRVYYPGGGRMLLLHWWTYDDRGHVVLATTERSLRATAQRVFDEHSDADIKAYCEIEVVAPSAHMVALAAKHTLRESIDSFHQEVVFRVREAVGAGRPLPPQFALCTGYESVEEQDDETGAGQKWAAETHYDCRHCKETIVLVGMTPDELYARYHAAWQKAHPKPGHHDPKHVLSRATPARDGEPLWIACADFGHHSSGIALDEVDLEASESHRTAALSDRVLFFFRRGRDLDPTALQETLDKIKGAAEARHTRYEEERRAQRDRETNDQIEATIAFFGGPPSAVSADAPSP
jgi:hypothetical protein